MLGYISTLTEVMLSTIGPMMSPISNMLSWTLMLLEETATSTKEIECSQFKNYCCDFFLQSAPCPICFYLVIPNDILGPCYTCFGHVMSLGLCHMGT